MIFLSQSIVSYVLKISKGCSSTNNKIFSTFTLLNCRLNNKIHIVHCLQNHDANLAYQVLD